MPNALAQEPKVERISAHGGHLISVSGVIDERFSRLTLAEGLVGVVVIDLDQVFRITSFGVREWRRAVSAIGSNDCYFVNCRPSIVAQFNMVDRFGGAGKLLSFYAPYMCPKCGKEFDLLLDLRQDFERIKLANAPAAPCPSCRALSEIDDIASDYFSYAASAPPPKPPPLVDALTKGGARGGVPNFRVEKKVAGSTTALSLYGTLDGSTRLKRPFDGLEGNVVVFGRHVSEVTPEGIRVLGEVLETKGPSFYLSRVSLPLARALAKNPAHLGRSSIVSVWLGCFCEKCARGFDADIDFGALKSLRAGTGGPCCHVCGNLARLEQPSALRDLDGLKLDPVPHDVIGQLARSTERTSRLPADREPFGRYELLKRIGAGGMAEVFLAVQRGVGDIEKRVVIKRLLPHLAANPQLVSMLLQEARLAARISHPNVVQTYDVGQTDGRYYIAMELVKGWDLNTLLRVSASLKRVMPIGVACRVAADMCAGLHAAHICTDENGQPLGIVHRDVSPHNVLLTHDGHVKITDFGIAKASDGLNSNLTPSTSIKGKLSYVAPEQVNPTLGPSDARTDIFAAGIVLMQCLTLEHPFRRVSDVATLRAILEDPVPSLRAVRQEVPELVELIAARSLERRLEKRYADASLMKADLEQVTRGLGQPTTSIEVAGWLHELTQAAATVGGIPDEHGLTPTAHRQRLAMSQTQQLVGDDETPPLSV